MSGLDSDLMSIPLDEPDRVADQSSSLPPADPVQLLPLQRYLGLEVDGFISLTDQRKVEQIWNHFAPNADSPGDILRLLRDMENEIVGPAGGEERLSKIYTYITLLEEHKDKERELRAYRKTK